MIPAPHDGDYLDPINATHPCYTSIANEPFRSDCRWHSRNVKVFGNEFRFDQANVPCAGTYCGVQALYAQGADNLPWMPYTVAEIQQSVMHTSGNSFHDNTYVGNWKFAKGWGETVSWNAWRSAPFNQEAGSTLNGVTDPPPVPNALDEDTATLEGSLGQWDAWYGSAVQRAAEAAHGGAYGLRIDVTEDGGWGVQLGNWPGFDAAPGGKRVSVWARQGTPGISTATLRLRWYDARPAGVAERRDHARRAERELAGVHRPAHRTHGHRHGRAGTGRLAPAAPAPRPPRRHRGGRPALTAPGTDARARISTRGPVRRP